MSKFAYKLPEPYREELMEFIAEGCMVVNALLHSSLGVLDAAARIMAVPRR